MRRSPIPPTIAVAVVCAALVLASLGYFGVVERRISVGGRTGHISYHEGLSAVIDGWFFFGAALGVLGIFANASRFKRLIWLGLAVLWLGAVTVFFLWFY
jgi:hypothetical protein